MIVETRGFVLRRNLAIIALAAIVFAAGVLAVLLGGRDATVWGLLLAYFGGVCAPLFYWRNAFPHARPAAIRASASGVQIDHQLEIRTEDITEAKLTTRRRDAIVELAVRDQPALVLRMPTAEGRSLVDLVGARRTRFRLIASYGKRFLVCFVLFALLSLRNIGEPELFVISLPALALWGAISGWALGFVRGRLVVGADGITIRWLFRSRYIPFRDVASVQGRQRRGDARAQDTIVTLGSGKRVHLHAVEMPNTDDERGAEGLALLEHVRAAFARSRQLQDGAVNLPALVERGARSDGEWLSGLDALVRGGGSRYRVAAVSAEMLVQIATDPSASVESRAGASAALVRMDDEALRTRVRVAAEACASPEMRDTLLALADARDELTTEAALAKVARR